MIRRNDLKKNPYISKKITTFLMAGIIAAGCIFVSPYSAMASEDGGAGYEKETEAAGLNDGDTETVIVSESDTEQLTGDIADGTSSAVSEDTALNSTELEESTAAKADSGIEEDANPEEDTKIGEDTKSGEDKKTEGKDGQDSDPVEVQKPDAPSITKTINAYKGVKISWTKVADVDGYYIYRSENGSDFEKIKTVNSPKSVSFYDYSANNDGSKYSYKIQSYILNDGIYTESDDSAEAFLYRLARPEKISATALTSGGIDVKWKSTATADGYNIYRRVNDGGYEFLASVKGNSKTQYRDKTATKNGTVYRYKVSAYKTMDGEKYESYYSNIMIACALNKTDVKSVTNPGYKQIKVSWKKNSAADGYRITCKRGNSTRTVYITGSGTTSTKINVSSSTGTYEVYVCAYKTIKRDGLSDVKRYSLKGTSKTITLQKNILSVAVSDSAMTIRLKNTNPSYTGLKVAVWSSERGQDDLVWENLSYVSDGYYKVKLSPSLFRSSGTFYIHIYNGSKFVAGATATWDNENIGFKNGQLISLDKSWLYADHTSVNSGAAVFYRATSNRKGIIVAINAGHGTSGSYNYYNLSHPDGSPKTTGGSTAAGNIWTVCDNYGMSFNDGASENNVVLNVAGYLRNKLLAKGYDVLMLRDEEYCQLDVVSRTVIANNIADCHISIDYDGDGLSYDKGAFYCSVPDGIKGMYPTSTIWQQDNYLGECMIAGLANVGVGIYSGRQIPIDLMQTSYSTIPSVDIELGNQCTAHDTGTLSWYADGLAAGVDMFFS